MLRSINLNKRRLSVSVFALAACLGAPVLKAQERELGQAGLGEIVVTAQRKAENVQDVPVAITAVTSDVVERYQIMGLNSNLNGLAPNVVSASYLTGANLAINIRGIGGNNIGTTVSTGVARYLDGVYQARSLGMASDVADIDRIEILRGPQGTLYGRNATGGAINYITAAPKGEFYVRQELTLGNLDKLRTKTRLDLPSFADISVSLGYAHDERRGWVRNTQAGIPWDFTAASDGKIGKRTSAKWLGSRNTDAFFAAVRFAPQSLPVVADYKFNWSKGQFTNNPTQAIHDETFGALRPEPITMKALDEMARGFTTPERTKVFGHNFTLTWDIEDDIQFKSITGYTGLTDSLSADVFGGGISLPGAPNYFNFVSQIVYERQHAFSQEAQISYRSDSFDLIAGAYYFNEKLRTIGPNIQGMPTPLSNGVPAPIAMTSTTVYNPLAANTRNSFLGRSKSFALFGQATFHVSSELDLTGGIRHTWDRRRLISDGGTWVVGNTQANAGGVANCGGLGGNLDSVANACFIPYLNFPADAASGGQMKFGKTNWTVNVTYRPTNDHTVYAKAGTGYLVGGAYNGRAYQPESITQYEFGFKSDLLDRRLRLNVAAFYSDYKNVQVPANEVEPPYLLRFFNVGKAQIKGTEVELTVLPTENLTLGMNYGYLDYKNKRFILPSGDVTNTANEDWTRPKHTLGLNGEYRFAEIGKGIQPSINISASWQADRAMYLQPATTGLSPTNPRYAARRKVDQAAEDNAMWLVDARATFAQIPVGNAKGKVSFWGRNILDERKPTYGVSIGSFALLSYAEPRTYGMDLAIEF